MSTNLEYRERESRREANEAQREKERQRARAEIKKQRRHFLLEQCTLVERYQRTGRSHLLW